MNELSEKRGVCSHLKRIRGADALALPQTKLILVQNDRNSNDKIMTNCQDLQSGKILKNPLDKREKKCYNMRAVNEKRHERDELKAPQDHEKV